MSIWENLEEKIETVLEDFFNANSFICDKGKTEIRIIFGDAVIDASTYYSKELEKHIR